MNCSKVILLLQLAQRKCQRAKDTQPLHEDVGVADRVFVKRAHLGCSSRLSFASVSCLFSGRDQLNAHGLCPLFFLEAENSHPNAVNMMM